MANITGVNPPAINDVDYVDKITNSFNAVDAHDHSSGKGLQIPAGGIAANAITSAEIATNAVGTAEIANDAVTTAKILNGNVTYAKLATTTASRALVSDGSGVITPATTTSTEIGYVNGVTSAIQTQLNAKQATGNYITSLTTDVVASGAGAAAATIQSNVVTNAKLAQMPTLTIKGNNTGGTANALDLTVTQVNTILGSLSNPMSAPGQMIYGGASGVATVVAAGTSGQFLKSNGTSAPTFTTFTAPTVQRFTSGSGTYTTPAGVVYIRVTVVGGGGGGGGSCTLVGNASAGGTGGNSTFGSTLLVGNGGVGGGANGNISGTGGTASISGPTTVISVSGGAGINGAVSNTATVSPVFGGAGGAGYFGGAGRATGNATGEAGAANSGAGAGGAGQVQPAYSGAGGGSGGTAIGTITSPSASYAYAVGAGGGAGAAGTSGSNGGVGGTGVVIVEEFYN